MFNNKKEGLNNPHSFQTFFTNKLQFIFSLLVGSRKQQQQQRSSNFRGKKQGNARMGRSFKALGQPIKSQLVFLCLLFEITVVFRNLFMGANKKPKQQFSFRFVNNKYLM